jgi:hypothetical protein
MFLRQWFLPIKMISDLASLPIKSNFQPIIDRPLFCALLEQNFPYMASHSSIIIHEVCRNVFQSGTGMLRMYSQYTL